VRARKGLFSPCLHMSLKDKSYGCVYKHQWERPAVHRREREREREKSQRVREKEERGERVRRERIQTI